MISWPARPRPLYRLRRAVAAYDRLRRQPPARASVLRQSRVITVLATARHFCVIAEHPSCRGCRVVTSRVLISFVGFVVRSDRRASAPGNSMWKLADVWMTLTPRLTEGDGLVLVRETASDDVLRRLLGEWCSHRPACHASRGQLARCKQRRRRVIGNRNWGDDIDDEPQDDQQTGRTNEITLSLSMLDGRGCIHAPVAALFIVSASSLRVGPIDRVLYAGHSPASRRRGRGAKLLREWQAAGWLMLGMRADR